MPLLTRRRLFTAVIIVALLAVNIVALRWSSIFFRSTPTSVLLRYGDRIPRLKGPSLVGQTTVELSTSGSNLILYFSSTQAPGLSIELLKYAEILSRRHGKEGLKVTAIVPASVEELKTLVEHSLVNYDLIVDTDRELGGKLGLAQGENGVFFFDQQGLCRLSTRRHMSASDLRQIVAMEFLRVDPLEKAAAALPSIEKGTPLGSWSLLDLRSWKPISLDQIRFGAGASRRFVFFTADCSVCSLPGYLEEFEKFERGQSETAGATTVLVFDFNFSTNDVLGQLKNHNINSPAFIAYEELPAVLEQTEAQSDKKVVVVQTDAQGTVLDISSMKSLVDGRNNSSGATTTSQSVQPYTAGVAYEEMFRDLPLFAYDVTAFGGRYILTDFKDNRVFLVKENMEVEKDFGRIGSGPGRLLHPGCLDVGRNGTIFVQDGGNERIVKFTMDGGYLGSLPIANYEGLAVGARDEIYLGQPEEGHLITVYSSSGEKLRSFGQLKKFSEVHGSAFADRDIPFKTAFNRVRLATDKEGNLYVSFMITPLIQKYSPDGALLFERKLEAPEIDRLMEAIQKTKYIGSTADGADARIVALDPVIEPASGNILVPLVDGSVYVANREGQKLAILRPRPAHRSRQAFYPFMAGLGAKGELLVVPFPPRRWYRLVLPTDLTSNMPAARAGKETTVAER